MDDSFTIIADDSHHRPIQIMCFERGSSSASEEEGDGRQKLIFKKEALQSIIGKHKNSKKPVAIYSIAGATGGGKSFFLRHLLTYLYKLEDQDKKQETQVNSSSSISSSTSTSDNGLSFGHQSSSKLVPRDLFTFGHGEAERTLGIWMWSHPFSIKLANGENILLFVMDTQGVFDELTSQREWSIIVGLSLLTSSTQIFNFTHNIDESHLEFFASFLSYGLHAKGKFEEKNDKNEEDKRPFQKLVFLVRDWNTPAQHEFGLGGGTKFMEKKLQIKPTHSPVQREVRQKLTNSFDLIQCHLLPFPGREALHPQFDGELSKLNASFQENLEECLSLLADPTKIVLNRLGGIQHLTAPILLKIFENYVTQFNGHELPDPESVYAVTRKIFDSALLKECTNQYAGWMEEGILKQKFLFDDAITLLHEGGMEISIQKFRHTQKLQDIHLVGAADDPKILKMVEERLVKKIDKCRHQFYFKNYVQRETTLKEGKDQARHFYKMGMGGQLDGVEFFEEDGFQIISTGLEVKAMSLFHRCCQPVDWTCEAMGKEKDLLKDDILTMKDGFLRFNKLKKEQIESRVNREVMEVVTKYKEIMTKELENRYYPLEDLNSFHQKNRQKLLAEFSGKQFQSRLFQSAPTEAEFLINAAFTSIGPVVSTVNQKILARGCQLVQKSLETYAAHLRKFDGFQTAHPRKYDVVNSQIFEILHNKSYIQMVQLIHADPDCLRSEKLTLLLVSDFEKQSRRIRQVIHADLMWRTGQQDTNVMAAISAALCGSAATAIAAIEAFAAVSAGAAITTAAGPVVAVAAVGTLVGGAVGYSTFWTARAAAWSSRRVRAWWG